MLPTANLWTRVRHRAEGSNVFGVAPCGEETLLRVVRDTCTFGVRGIERQSDLLINVPAADRPDALSPAQFTGMVFADAHKQLAGARYIPIPCLTQQTMVGWLVAGLCVIQAVLVVNHGAPSALSYSLAIASLAGVLIGGMLQHDTLFRAQETELDLLDLLAMHDLSHRPQSDALAQTIAPLSRRLVNLLQRSSPSIRRLADAILDHTRLKAA